VKSEAFSNIKETLEREVESLRATGEELRLQASLACADVRAEWNQIEMRLQLAREELARLSNQTHAAKSELEARVRSLIEEIKVGYERIRSAA
jgi:predicted  nucleic acid-binding Zn-ribbon protein